MAIINGMWVPDDDEEIVEGSTSNSGNFLNNVGNALSTGLGYIKSGLGSLTQTIGTGKNAKNGLDYLSSLGSLGFDIWKSNKELSLYKQGIKNSKELALANLSNSIGTQGANMGQMAIMSDAFDHNYGQKVAANYSAALQNGANTITNLGGDASGIQNQISNLNKLVA